METLKIIQIGVGGFGRGWLKSIKNFPGLELVAAVDVVDASLAGAREIMGNDSLPLYTSHLDAFREIKADAVLIITPPRTHVKIAADAMEAGLHILMEKPLTYSMEEAEELSRLYAAYPKKMMINQNYRWYPHIMALKEGLDQGLIGKLAYVDWSFRRLHVPSGGTWRVQSSDFLFTDVSVHHFDMMRFLLGMEPESVTAQGTSPSWSWCEGITVGGAIFNFPDGVQANYFGTLEETGTMTSWNGTARFVGSEGAIELTNDIPTLVKKDGTVEALPLPKMEQTSKGYTLQEFVKSIQQDTVPVTDVSDNLRTFLMVQGVIKSARTNERFVYDYRLSEEAARSGI